MKIRKKIAMKDKKNIFFILLFFVLLGIFLRFYQLNFENYWWDEMLGFWTADPNVNINETISRHKNHDHTSILFHLILKNYYSIVGYNPEFGRYIPFFFGVLSLPFLGILSKQIKNNNSYILSILLISINIYLINYSQETRVYSLIFLLCIINLIFYYKILYLNNFKSKNFKIFIFFTLSSIISLWLSPFVLIILFSQMLYCLYTFVLFKIKHYLFIFSVPLILVIYFLLNYDYILSELVSKKSHFVEQINLHFFYDFFFSRFFGSDIMGLIYLSIFIFLLFYCRKKIFSIKNNFLPLVFILFFSYFIPIIYGFIAIPILFDRYIIFVLIPIILLISILVFEIKKKYLKNTIILILLTTTIINLFFETKLRDETKPEFNHIISYISDSDTKNLTVFVNNQKVDKKTLSIVENYIISLSISKKNNIRLFDFYNIPSTIKNIWVVCYEPLTGIYCKDYNNKNANWDFVEEKKYHLLSADLLTKSN